MGEAIRAEVEIFRPDRCRIAGNTNGATVTSVTRGGYPGTEGEVPVEFTVEGADLDPAPFDEVFDFGSRVVYRFTEGTDDPCACHVVERNGSPIRDVKVHDEHVVMSFLVADIDELRTIVTDLKDRGECVTIRRLTRSKPGADTGDLVFVDRSEITDRQRDVLGTAHRMGYFERPRRANAGEVAEALGISTATFTEHLSAAQSKLLEFVLESPDREPPTVSEQ